MAVDDPRSFSLSESSVLRLREGGLDFRLVDEDGFDDFYRAVGRGFLEAEPSREQLEAARTILAERRLAGVYDPASALREPVATIDSWVSEITIDTDRFLPLWAISAVTVAPTHRRRGIARSMLEGELRSAADAGVPLAGLTVSEATIYGRFGFGPAVFTSDVTIATGRVRWAGPVDAGGRLDIVGRGDAASDLATLHDRVRRSEPGQVPGWESLWRRHVGDRPGVPNADRIRTVRYTDADGQVRGAMVYRLTGGEDDYSAHVLTIEHFVADGDEATAALWRFALEHDLVSEVRADLRPSDDPVRWMISDQRAATVRTVDHEWLRVLDVPRVLTSRSYRRPGAAVVRVHDDLGFADGTWRFSVSDDGEAAVEALPEQSSPDAEIPVSALGSMLLGGVRVGALAAAGRVRATETTRVWLDETFVARTSPRLSIWY